MEEVHVKLNAGLPLQKQYSTSRRLLSPKILELNLRKKLVRCYIWGTEFMVLTPGYLGKIIRSN
jgi:hypothetical protein